MADEIVDPFEGMVDPFADAPAPAPTAPLDVPRTRGEHFVEAIQPWKHVAKDFKEGASKIMPGGQEMDDYYKEAAGTPWYDIRPEIKRTVKTGAGLAQAALSPITGTTKSLEELGETVIPSPTPEEAEELKSKGLPQPPGGKDLVSNMLAVMMPGKAPVRGPAPRAPAPAAVSRPSEVLLSEGQASGNLPAIQKEQAAYQGTSGKPAQEKAISFFEGQQRPQLESATDAVRESMQPVPPPGAATLAPIASPRDAAERVVGSLSRVHDARTTSQTQAAQDIERAGEMFLQRLSPTNTVLARSPDEAAGIVSQAVGAADDAARARTTAAYDALEALEGRYHPASFNRAAQEIRTRVANPEDPTQLTLINAQTTPQANAALDDLGEILGGIAQRRDPDTGRVLPRTEVTPQLVSNARKRMSTFNSAALSAARSTGNWADVRAMDQVMREFDALVARKTRGNFTGGDPEAVLDAFAASRRAHADHRQTFSSRGSGDKVGGVIQNIIGRHEGQALTPEQVAKTLYEGQAAVPVARRLNQIFADTPEVQGALKQGLLSHITQAPAGKTAYTPEQVANRIEQYTRGSGRSLTETYLNPNEVRALRLYGDAQRRYHTEASARIDPVERQLRRITGADGDARASIDDSMGSLFGNILRSDQHAPELVRRLTSGPNPLLNPADVGALREGTLRYAMQAQKGEEPLGYKRIRDNLHQLATNEAGRALFSPQQREMIEELRDLHEKLIVPKDGKNWSNTAPFLSKIVEKVGDKVIGVVVTAIAHAANVGWGGSELLGYGAAKLSNTFSARKAARDVAKNLPMINQRLAEYQKALNAHNKQVNKDTTRRLKAATTSFNSATQRLGGEIPALQLPGTGRAEDEKNRADGGAVVDPFDQPQQGQQEPGFLDKVSSAANAAYDYVAPGLPLPARASLAPLSEKWRQGFSEGVHKSGGLGTKSYFEAVNNEYVPEGATQQNDAGEYLDKDGNVLNTQRRPNILPVTKAEKPGEGWFGSNYEGAMPAMADVWNTTGSPKAALVAARTGGESKLASQAAQAAQAARLLEGNFAHHPDYVFHGTSDKNLQSIKKKGFNPNTYYATDPSTAWEEAGYAVTGDRFDDARRGIGGNPVVLAVPKRDLQNARLKADPGYAGGNDGADWGSAVIAADRVPFNGKHYASYNELEPLFPQMKNSSLYADSGTEGKVASQVAQFYSATERAIENAKQAKATPEQWVNWLRNQPGVTKDELAHLDLDTWANLNPGKAVTKEELLQHAQGQGLGLEEDVRQSTKKFTDRERDALNTRGNEIGHELTELHAQGVDERDPRVQQLMQERDAIRQEFATGTTKYHDYTLPGGENYREIISTLPSGKDPHGTSRRFEEFRVEMQKKYGGDWNNAYSTEERAKHQQLLEALQQASDKSDTYTHSHWPGVENPLYHMRVNDREIPGVGKSLHLEELQSDWHQQGRKKGYKGRNELPELKWTESDDGRDFTAQLPGGNYVEMEKRPSGGWDAVTPTGSRMGLPSREAAEEWIRSRVVEHLDREGVPDAPFKKNWAELGLRNALLKAVQEGKDAISWTPGIEQAKRYNIGNHVDKITSWKETPQSDKFTIEVMDKRGHEVRLPKQELTADEIAEYLGKEVAEKIVKRDGKSYNIPGEDKYRTLENVDLRVGGEGMKAFYDKMLVNKANDLGKKYGAKVEWKPLNKPAGGPSENDIFHVKDGLHDGEEGTFAITSDGRKLKDGWYYLDEDGEEVGPFRSKNELLKKTKTNDSTVQIPVLKITPELREHIQTKGLPIFSDSGTEGKATSQAAQAGRELTPKQHKLLSDWVDSMAEGPGFEEALKQLPTEPGTLYRGLVLQKDAFNKFKPGETLTLRRNSSASSEYEVAAEFGGMHPYTDGPMPDQYSVMLEIDQNSARRLPNEDYNAYAESILPKDTVFRVESVGDGPADHHGTPTKVIRLKDDTSAAARESARLFSMDGAEGKTASQVENAIADLGKHREKKQLEKFHGELSEEIRTNAQERAKLGREYHEEGKLPFEVGTRFTTEHGRRNNKRPVEVEGYYVDSKDPNKYGYYIKRGTEADEDYERGIYYVNDSKRPNIKELSDQFKPFKGLSVIKAESGAEGRITSQATKAWATLSAKEKEEFRQAALPYMTQRNPTDKQFVREWWNHNRDYDPEGWGLTEKEAEMFTTYGDIPEPGIDAAYNKIRKNPAFGAALKKLPKYKGPVHRGVFVPTKELESLEPGKIIDVDRHSAATPQKNSAKDFIAPDEYDPFGRADKYYNRKNETPVLMRIEGGSFPNFSKSGHSSFGGNEVIVPMGTKLEVVSSKRVGKIQHVTLKASDSKKPGVPTRSLFADSGTEGRSASQAAQSQRDQKKVARPVDKGQDQDAPEAQNRAAGGRVVAANINHRPSEAQKEAGNYSKDKVHICGLLITIENAKGRLRSGVSKDGQKWSCKLPAHYGYVNGSVGADKDHVDVYVGPHARAPHVFVIDQYDAETGKFDEHKCFLGFGSEIHAMKTYLAGFSDGKGSDRFGAIKRMTVPEFKKWVFSAKAKKPIAS